VGSGRPGAEDVLGVLNNKMMKMSCEEVFIQNPVSFDGSSLIKKFGEIQSVFIVLSKQNPDIQQRLQQCLMQGLWKLNPVMNEQTKL